MIANLLELFGQDIALRASQKSKVKSQKSKVKSQKLNTLALQRLAMS